MNGLQTIQTFVQVVETRSFARRAREEGCVIELTCFQ